MEEMDLPEIEVGNRPAVLTLVHPPTICYREMKREYNMLRRKLNF